MYSRPPFSHSITPPPPPPPPPPFRRPSSSSSHAPSSGSQDAGTRNTMRSSPTSNSYFSTGGGGNGSRGGRGGDGNGAYSRGRYNQERYGRVASSPQSSFVSYEFHTNTRAAATTFSSEVRRGRGGGNNGGGGGFTTNNHDRDNSHFTSNPSSAFRGRGGYSHCDNGVDRASSSRDASGRHDDPPSYRPVGGGRGRGRGFRGGGAGGQNFSRLDTKNYSSAASSSSTAFSRMNSESVSGAALEGSTRSPTGDRLRSFSDWMAARVAATDGAPDKAEKAVEVEAERQTVAAPSFSVYQGNTVQLREDLESNVHRPHAFSPVEYDDGQLPLLLSHDALLTASDLLSQEDLWIDTIKVPPSKREKTPPMQPLKDVTSTGKKQPKIITVMPGELDNVEASEVYLTDWATGKSVVACPITSSSITSGGGTGGGGISGKYVSRSHAWRTLSTTSSPPPSSSPAHQPKNTPHESSVNSSSSRPPAPLLLDSAVLSVTESSAVASSTKSSSAHATPVPRSQACAAASESVSQHATTGNPSRVEKSSASGWWSDLPRYSTQQQERERGQPSARQRAVAPSSTLSSPGSNALPSSTRAPMVSPPQPRSMQLQQQERERDRDRSSAHEGTPSKPKWVAAKSTAGTSQPPQDRWQRIPLEELSARVSADNARAQQNQHVPAASSEPASLGYNIPKPYSAQFRDGIVKSVQSTRNPIDSTADEKRTGDAGETRPLYSATFSRDRNASSIPFSERKKGEKVPFRKTRIEERAFQPPSLPPSESQYAAAAAAAAAASKQPECPLPIGSDGTSSKPAVETANVRRGTSKETTSAQRVKTGDKEAPPAQREAEPAQPKSAEAAALAEAAASVPSSHHTEGRVEMTMDTIVSPASSIPQKLWEQVVWYLAPTPVALRFMLPVTRRLWEHEEWRRACNATVLSHFPELLDNATAVMTQNPNQDTKSSRPGAMIPLRHRHNGLHVSLLLDEAWKRSKLEAPGTRQSADETIAAPLVLEDGAKAVHLFTRTPVNASLLAWLARPQTARKGAARVLSESPRPKSDSQSAAAAAALGRETILSTSIAQAAKVPSHASNATSVNLSPFPETNNSETHKPAALVGLAGSLDAIELHDADDEDDLLARTQALLRYLLPEEYAEDVSKRPRGNSTSEQLTSHGDSQTLPQPTVSPSNRADADVTLTIMGRNAAETEEKKDRSARSKKSTSTHLDHRVHHVSTHDTCSDPRPLIMHITEEQLQWLETALDDIPGLVGLHCASCPSASTEDAWNAVMTKLRARGMIRVMRITRRERKDGGITEHPYVEDDDDSTSERGSGPVPKRSWLLNYGGLAGIAERLFSRQEGVGGGAAEKTVQQSVAKPSTPTRRDGDTGGKTQPSSAVTHELSASNSPGTPASVKQASNSEQGFLTEPRPLLRPASNRASSPSALQQQQELKCMRSSAIPNFSLNGFEDFPHLFMLSLESCSMHSLEPLAACRELRELYIQSNSELTSLGLKAGIETLPHLEILWLEETGVRELEFLKNCVSLREVHVAMNPSFTSSSLRGVEELPRLTYLCLDHVFVDDVGFLQRSVSLRQLIMTHCRVLSGSALAGIEKVPQLEVLSLEYANDIRSVSFLADAPNLRQLLLTRCHGLNTAGLQGIEKIATLQTLTLEHTRVDSVTFLAAAPALRELRLKGCKRILRMSIEGLEKSKSLRYLSLKETNVITVAGMAGSSSIKELNLDGCKHLDQEGAESLSTLSALTVLRMGSVPITSVSFLERSATLRELFLDDCTKLTSEGIAALASVKTLEVLSLCGAREIDSVALLASCPKLKTLKLNRLGKLKSDGLEGIERAASLSELHLEWCAVDSVSFLSRGCRRLTVLNLRGCQQIASDGLRGVETLPSLRELILDDQSQLDDISFLTACPSLRKLSIQCCPLLSIDSVHDFHVMKTLEQVFV